MKRSTDLLLPVRPQPREESIACRRPCPCVEHLQQPFVALRLRLGSPLRLLDDLPRVVLRDDRQRASANSDAASATAPRSTLADRRWPIIHIPAPPRATPRTADSAGQSAEKNAAARIVGSSISAMLNGKPVRQTHARQIASRNLQHVIQIGGAKQQARARGRPAPMATASIQIVCRICRRKPPTARSTPSSRLRSMIDTVSVLTMPRIATSTAMNTWL